MKYFIYGLQLAFIVLKLTGFIAWSWFLIFMPFMAILLVKIIVFTALLYQKLRVERAKKAFFEDLKSGSPEPKKSNFQTRLDDYMREQYSNKRKGGI